MKIYPLEIEVLTDDDNEAPMAYFSKGHHDRQVFLAELKLEWEYEAKPEDVHHTHGRWNVATPDDNHNVHFAYAASPNYGVFPVTIVEVPYF
jgi:hypothetical protein